MHLLLLFMFVFSSLFDFHFSLSLYLASSTLKGAKAHCFPLFLVSLDKKIWEKNSRFAIHSYDSIQSRARVLIAFPKKKLIFFLPPLLLCTYQIRLILLSQSTTDLLRFVESPMRIGLLNINFNIPCNCVWSRWSPGSYLTVEKFCCGFWFVGTQLLKTSLQRH